MNPDALCSCGSGKQYKLCCGKSPAMISLKAASTWFFIGLLVCGITVMAWLMSIDNDDSPAANTPPTNRTNQPALGLGSNSSILNPTNWQYDPITDRHWHAVGNHWAPGRHQSTNSPSSILSQPLAIQPDLGSIKAPDIPNPQPWQYDPITNRHWDPTPGHVHWHPGQAPDDRGQ